MDFIHHWLIIKTCVTGYPLFCLYVQERNLTGGTHRMSWLKFTFILWIPNFVKVCYILEVKQVDGHDIMVLCEGLWVTHCVCTCHIPKMPWLNLFILVHDFWESGRTSLFVPWTTQRRLYWLIICSGELFFLSSSCNKDLCQSWNKLHVVWHLLRIWKVILEENNCSVVHICPPQHKTDTQHSGIEK